MARFTVKLVRDVNQKSTFLRPFNIDEFFLLTEKAEEEAMKQNYNKYASLTHADAGGCEQEIKTRPWAYMILNEDRIENR